MSTTSPSPTPEGPVGRALDWAVVLKAHDRWLRTVVRTRLNEGQAVDEVMQEVALAAVAQRAPLAEPARVAAWLYRLAVRQALLYRRARGRQGHLVERYAQRARHGESEGEPLGWLLRDERRQLVREAMRKLPPRDAEILLLKYTEGWSYRELAERLGVGQAAVEARLHRARGRLREELSGMTDFEVSP